MINQTTNRLNSKELSWSLLRDKANENLFAANNLLKHKKYGLAAYHAQQCVELTIKAFCYKHSFNDYLAKNESIRTHNPSQIILSKYFNHLIDMTNRIDRRNLDEDIEQGLDKTLKLLEELKKILEKAEKDHNFLKQLWKYSLKVEIESEKIKNWLKKVQEYDTNDISLTLSGKIVISGHDLLLQKISASRRAHNLKSRFQIETILGETVMEPLRLPKSLVKPFLYKSEAEFESELTIAVKDRDPMEIFDLIYGPQGLIEQMNQLGIAKKDSTDTLKNTFHIWGVMVTICKIAILTYPHETFGRYPEEIKDKTTEEIYQNKSDVLKDMILECDKTYQRITNML